MRLTYFCPNCQSPLPKRAVLFAGPFGRKQCPVCGEEYFGGGLAKAIWILCGFLYVGVLLFAFTNSASVLLISVAVGTLCSVALTLRSPPEPQAHKWRETLLAMAAPFALWALFKITTFAAKQYAQWLLQQ